MSFDIASIFLYNCINNSSSTTRLGEVPMDDPIIVHEGESVCIPFGDRNCIGIAAETRKFRHINADVLMRAYCLGHPNIFEDMVQLFLVQHISHFQDVEEED